MVRIRLRENGPIVIESDEVTVVDWNGQPYEISRTPIALCRCGGSSTKPFCDGSHKRNGFQGGEPAAPAPAPVASPSGGSDSPR